MKAFCQRVLVLVGQLIADGQELLHLGGRPGFDLLHDGHVAAHHLENFVQLHLRELDLGGDTKIYDPNFLEHPTHNHLVCVDCKKIIEFEDPNMELLENCISRRLGFSPTNKRLTIEARCDEFQQRGTCKKANTEAAKA